MEPLEVLLTPHVWLQIPADVRNEMTKAFGIPSSESPRCVTQAGMTKIESDGHTVNDLRKLNVTSMQEFLGFTTVDPKADLHALLQLCAKKVWEQLHPVIEEKIEAEEEEIKPQPVEDKAIVFSKRRGRPPKHLEGGKMPMIGQTL